MKKVTLFSSFGNENQNLCLVDDMVQKSKYIL